MRTHRINVWYICLHLVDVSGFHVGKYASPMDNMVVYTSPWPMVVYPIIYRVLYIHGGGNSNIFGMFTPKIGEDEPNLTVAYFSDGVDSTTNRACI